MWVWLFERNKPPHTPKKKGWFIVNQNLGWVKSLLATHRKLIFVTRVLMFQNLWVQAYNPLKDYNFCKGCWSVTESSPNCTSWFFVVRMTLKVRSMQSFTSWWSAGRSLQFQVFPEPNDSGWWRVTSSHGEIASYCLIYDYLTQPFFGPWKFKVLNRFYFSYEIWNPPKV